MHIPYFDVYTAFHIIISFIILRFHITFHIISVIISASIQHSRYHIRHHFSVFSYSYTGFSKLVRVRWPLPPKAVFLVTQYAASAAASTMAIIAIVMPRASAFTLEDGVTGLKINGFFCVPVTKTKDHTIYIQCTYMLAFNVIF